MFEEICLAIENACSYICKVRKYFSLISRKSWQQFRRKTLLFITYARNHSHPRPDATLRIDVPSRNDEQTLPLSIWWIIVPFIASMLANNRRSSSFSFLPKKTMITTFNSVPPLETLFPSQFRWNLAASLFTLSHSHYCSFTCSITFLPRKIVAVPRPKYHFILFNTVGNSKFKNLRLTGGWPCRYEL